MAIKFLPYAEAGRVRNVIVDGERTTNTVLTLSHWPKSGTPAALKGDTSTAIVFNYLDAPALHVEADTASNNHFDEDGLVGIFALTQPAIAMQHRDLLVDVAEAGDFGIFKKRQAARTAFTLAAYANAASSPLDNRLFTLPYPEMAARLYVELLDVLPRLLTNLDDYRDLWEREDFQLAASEALVDRGVITFEERPELDLAVVRMPEALERYVPRALVSTPLTECHPYALHNRTPWSRLLIIQGRRVELRYRYESWVQMASKRPAARVDLTPLSDELNQEETSGGRWVFDGVDEITPRLHCDGAPGSSIPPDRVVALVEQHLQSGPPAWNPYD